MDGKGTDKTLSQMDIYQYFHHFIFIQNAFWKPVFAAGLKNKNRYQDND